MRFISPIYMSRQDFCKNSYKTFIRDQKDIASRVYNFFIAKVVIVVTPKEGSSYHSKKYVL